MGIDSLIIPGKGSDTTSMMSGSLLGEETQVSLAGRFELSVRPEEEWRQCRQIMFRIQRTVILIATCYNQIR